jgi:hypothetical protein
MDLIELEQLQGVAASSVATLATDRLIDRSLHALVFQRGGGAFTNAHLASIMMRVDGKEVVKTLTGAQLVDINEYEGLTDVTNYTVLPFGDMTARTIRGQHLGDIDFSIYRKPLELEISIGAATTPTLKVWALCGAPKLQMGIGYTPEEAAQIRALIRTVLTPSAAVDRKTFALSLGSSLGARLRRAYLFHTNLTAVELYKQGERKWNNVPTALNSALAQQFARVPQSGLYVLDRIVDGNQGEAEATVRDDGRPWSLEMNLTTSNSDTITAFADVYHTLPGL